MTAHDAFSTQCGLQGLARTDSPAGSGVGTAANQLVRAAGAVRVRHLAHSVNLEKALAFGLSESVVIDTDPSQFSESVKSWTRGAGVNVILDLVGAAYLKSNLEALAAKGRLIFVGTPGGAKAEIDYSVVMGKRLRLMGTSLRTRSIEEKSTATRLFAQHVVPLLASGEVRPVIDRVYRLYEVRSAHERIESNENFGKLCWRLNSDLVVRAFAAPCSHSHAASAGDLERKGKGNRLTVPES